MAELRVHVTEHALTRGRQRFSPPLTRGLIRREVELAVLERRVAKRPPRWACRDERYRQATHRRVRHVWPEDMSRCYIVHLPRRGGEASVITVLAPGSRLLDVVATAA